jgi:hypothetical protein
LDFRALVRDLGLRGLDVRVSVSDLRWSKTSRAVSLITGAGLVSGVVFVPFRRKMRLSLDGPFACPPEASTLEVGSGSIPL